MIKLPADLPVLMTLLDTARDLSEPGEENKEYVRGQVNLITDLIEEECAGELFGDLFPALHHAPGGHHRPPGASAHQDQSHGLTSQPERPVPARQARGASLPGQG